MRHINRHPTPGMRLMLVMLPFVLLLAAYFFWLGGQAGGQPAGQAAARPAANAGRAIPDGVDPG